MFSKKKFKKILTKFIVSPVIKLSKNFSRRNLYEWLIKDLKLLETFSKKSLCIGAGGEIEFLIKKNSNLNLTTIDIDEVRGPDYVMDATNLKFEDEVFDLIIMMETLEHIKEPYKAIKECYRVLKPSGKLIISTPFILGIHDSPNDYYRFTKFGLSYLLRDFRDVKIKNRNNYFESTIVLFLRYWSVKGLNNKILGLFFVLLLFPLVYIARLFDSLLNSDNSTTGYYSTAQKK